MSALAFDLFLPYVLERLLSPTRCGWDGPMEKDDGETDLQGDIDRWVTDYLESGKAEGEWTYKMAVQQRILAYNKQVFSRVPEESRDRPRTPDFFDEDDPYGEDEEDPLSFET